MAHVPLPGSHRAALPGSRQVSPTDAAERMEVSVIVRRRAGAVMRSRVEAIAAGDRTQPFMSREEFARAHGAEAADLAAVRKFAVGYGLTVLEEHAARRTVILSGTAAQFCAAFAVQLHHMEHDGGTYRGRTGEIMLPAELSGVVGGRGGAPPPPPTAGAAAFQAATRCGQGRHPGHDGDGAASSRGRGGFLHADAGCDIVWISVGHRRGRMRGARRTGRGLSPGGFENLFCGIGSGFAERGGGVRRPGQKCADRFRQRTGWRGDAGHRSGGRDRP